MDLCFLVSGFPAPTDAVSAHAQRLAADHGVTIALCDERPLATPDTTGPAVVSLQDALAGSYDVAVAFHWRATVALFEVQATRRAYHVDGFAHDAMALTDPLRVAARISYDLPVDFIAVAPWVARTLEELRPDARCVTVVPGVARGGGDGAPVVILDRDPAADVLAGRVVIASAAWPGVEDVIDHGENGFLIEPDDTAGAQRLVAQLSGDDALRARVAVAAQATPWPDADTAATAFATALQELRATEPPADGRWPRRLMADALSALTALPSVR